MLSNKLTTLLQNISKYDLNRFRKYLDSPFFNENEDLLRLFDLLHSHLKANNSSSIATLEKKVVWKQLFAKLPYKDVKMRRLCSDLTKHALSFLAIKQFKSTPLVEETFLLEALNDAALSKQYQSVLRAATAMQEQTTIKNADYYYYQHQILYNEYHFKANERTDFLQEFRLADHHLDCFYLINKLKSYCAELVNKKVMPVDGAIKMIPNLFEYLEKEAFVEIPSIKAYYLVAKMVTFSEEEDYFHQLKALLLNELSFAKSDLNELFRHLMNYCVIKINGGNTDYYYQLFDLYKVALAKKIIIDKERLDFQHYKNIIGIGLKVKDYEWVEEFIQQYTQYLTADKRDNALNYNLANVYFSQKKYDQVIEQLNTVQYKNHIYALNSKTILLKTYFELKEYQALDSLIDSFRIYIRRNKSISKEVQQQYLNLLRFVKKIGGILPKDKAAIAKVSGQIDKCKALAGKKWVLEKVDELK